MLSKYIEYTVRYKRLMNKFHSLGYYCSCNLPFHQNTSVNLTGYSSHCGQMVDFKVLGRPRYVVHFLPFVLANNLYKNFTFSWDIQYVPLVHSKTTLVYFLECPRFYRKSSNSIMLNQNRPPVHMPWHPGTN